MKHTCFSCKYYEGEYCKRYPPTFTFVLEEDIDGACITRTNSEYPKVCFTDWCGEYVRKCIKEESKHADSKIKT